MDQKKTKYLRIELKPPRAEKFEKASKKRRRSMTAQVQELIDALIAEDEGK